MKMGDFKGNLVYISVCLETFSPGLLVEECAMADLLKVNLNVPNTFSPKEIYVMTKMGMVYRLGLDRTLILNTPQAIVQSHPGLNGRCVLSNDEIQSILKQGESLRLGCHLITVEQILIVDSLKMFSKDMLPPGFATSQIVDTFDSQKSTK